MDILEGKSDDVGITITAPSDNEVDNGSSDSESENLRDFDNEVAEQSESLERNNEDTSDSKGPAILQNTTHGNESNLCERFDSGVSLNDEKSEDNDDNIGKNFEIVGDRVLVERDGKFELVDANEIKAEYFEMLGIKPESEEDLGSSENSAKPGEFESSRARERPKTTPTFGSRGKHGNSSPQPRKKRVQSSWGYRNSEYSKLKSPYGLSEQQLEIKRKRGEAIARRKKEEADRQREEERRKREDAERAFQAWLNSKREEEKERKRWAAMKDNHGDGNSRAEESQKAFKVWKATKKKQESIEREAATRRMRETASMYVVHDRGSCEDAFRRWLKKKNTEKKMKEIDKKKWLRQKSRQKAKEPLPVNSEKIRFTDNYGYRNTVVY